jgi:hypothetical protein
MNNEPLFRINQAIHAAFRVHLPQLKTSCNGREYLSMWLENCRFSVRGHIWKERYRGQQFHLAQDQRIVVYGKVRQFDRRWIIGVSSQGHIIQSVKVRPR